MADLTVTKLRNYWLARPEGALGTCGFRPYPWTAATGKTAFAAITAFVEEHRQHLPAPVTANYDDDPADSGRTIYTY